MGNSKRRHYMGNTTRPGGSAATYIMDVEQDDVENDYVRGVAAPATAVRNAGGMRNAWGEYRHMLR